MSDASVAYHLGRRGEVAGGMTQVVSEYLTWQFPTFKQVLLPSRGGSRCETFRLYLSARRRIYSIAGHRHSVLVAHLSQGGSFLREGSLVVAASRRGLPVVAQLHGSTFVAFARRHPRLVRHVLRHCQAVQVLSLESESAVAGLNLGVPIVRMPNAVSAVRAQAKERLVVFGGTVSHRKGVDVLLGAWRSMSDPADWRLVIAGPISDPGLVADLPAEVELRGSLTRAELLELLARAAIAVLPSRHEAMPMFIIEAMASRAAVIATPVGGIPEVLTDGAGVLVAVGDEIALSKVLKELMGDDQRVRELADAGYRRFRTYYSADSLIPRLEGLWSASIRRAQLTSVDLVS